MDVLKWHVPDFRGVVMADPKNRKSTNHLTPESKPSPVRRIGSILLKQFWDGLLHWIDLLWIRPQVWLIQIGNRLAAEFTFRQLIVLVLVGFVLYTSANLENCDPSSRHIELVKAVGGSIGAILAGRSNSGSQ